MKPASLLSALALGAGLFVMAAPAQARKPIRERLAHQQERIQRGVATGEISPGEANRLEMDEARAARHFRRARRRNGGGLGDRAHDSIQRQLDRNSAIISRDRRYGR